MNNSSDLAGDRGHAARQAAALAKLRAVEPGEANRLAAAIQAEPAPVAVHLGLLKKNFPTLRFLHSGWCPDLRDLANLATLRAFFSKKRPAPPQRGEPTMAEGIEELTRHFSR